MLRSVVFAAVVGLAAATSAQAKVRLVEAGIICPRESTGALIDAPGTEAGFIRRIDEGLTFDLPDRTVPTLDNLSFGFRTALKPGVGSQAVTVVVTHPPMGERGVIREEWDDVIEAGSQSLNLFTFELPYEKVPGAWVFSIEIDGEPVVSVPFEVTEVNNRGRIEQACFQFLS
ncbi:DUF3859 domain-containing protein [Jannaschia pohangensis]|uniref:DUF3859 domain-containing protein n=1 Tax=Jannaschia pohangensis TaxID=390807 RepID=A0A1I3LGA8_9RHOB|nr:DUF3859 domain-containing protein [Jannaschia pohangensis]SFI83818.1 protein of unknown function [Jannaschia pohangensis]